MVKKRKKNEARNGVNSKRSTKKTLSILLSSSLLFSMAAWPGGTDLSAGVTSPVKVSAADDAEDSETHFTYVLYTDKTDGVRKAEITGYAGTDWNLVIPKTVTDNGTEIPVGSIASEAFKENENVTGVTIPDGAEVMIKEKAFYGCPNLETVSLSSTVTWELRETAGSNTVMHWGSNFENCTSLTDLTLGDGITVLPDSVFRGCSSLKSVTLPSKLESFEDAAFHSCTSLETLVIPEGVQEIGRNGFRGCTSLTKVAIPSTIKKWCITEHLYYSNHAMNENAAFSGCTSLKEVTFAEGLTVLGSSSFFSEDNNSLSKPAPLESVTVPSTVTSLRRAFYGCEMLEEVILQEGALTTIGEKSFNGCKSLKSLQIPSTVTEIQEAAFGNCDSLKTLIFPPSVATFTGNTYFDAGSSLESVYFLAEEITVPKSLAYTSAQKIYCPAGSATYETYMSVAEKNHWDEGRVAEFTPDMLTPALLGVEVEGYQGVYDSEAHPLVTITGAQENEKISYRILEGENQEGESLENIPEKTEPGTYNIEVTLTRMGVNYTETVQAIISKKTPVIKLSDMTVNENDNWAVALEEYDGEADIIYYSFYQDEALENQCSGQPTAAGIYYVKAIVEESAHYTSGESNVAKIEILKKNDSNPDNPPPTNVTIKKVTIKKVKSPSKKTMEVRWKKVSNATGYIIWIAQNKKFTKGKKAYTIKSGKTVKKVIRKLKRKKKYFVKVQAYQVVSGKKYQGAFSKVKSVKIK